MLASSTFQAMILLQQLKTDNAAVCKLSLTLNTSVTSQRTCACRATSYPGQWASSCRTLTSPLCLASALFALQPTPTFHAQAMAAEL